MTAQKNKSKFLNPFNVLTQTSMTQRWSQHLFQLYFLLFIEIQIHITPQLLAHETFWLIFSLKWCLRELAVWEINDLVNKTCRTLNGIMGSDLCLLLQRDGRTTWTNGQNCVKAKMFHSWRMSFTVRVCSSIKAKLNFRIDQEKMANIYWVSCWNVRICSHLNMHTRMIKLTSTKKRLFV